MKLFTTLILTATLAIGLAIAWAFWGGTAKVAAQDKKSNQASQAKKDQAVVYSYVAQPGDSYSKLARKAIQTYGLKNKVNLTPAGIIYAETSMTIAAKSPFLNLGQKVDIPEATIKTWVDKAKNLSVSQKAAWNRYVPSVNFDTRAVGESS